MKRVIRSCFICILVFGLLLPGGRSFAEEITKKAPPTKVLEYKVDWLYPIQDLGYYTSYGLGARSNVNYRNEHLYGTTVNLKNGDAYFMVWSKKDSRNNAIVSINDEGKLNWIFKPKVAFDEFFHPVVDSKGNIYYYYKVKGEPEGIHYIQAIDNKGKIRWTTKLKTTDYKIHEYWLRTNAKEILFSSESKKYAISTQDGKAKELPKNQQKKKLIMGENNGYTLFLDNSDKDERFSVYEIYDMNFKLKGKFKEEFNANTWLNRGDIHLMEDGSVLFGLDEFDRGSKFVYYDYTGKKVWQHNFKATVQAGEYFTDGKKIFVGEDDSPFVHGIDRQTRVLDLSSGETLGSIKDALPLYVGSYEAKYRRNTRLDTGGVSNQLQPNDLDLYANVLYDNYETVRFNPDTLEPRYTEDMMQYDIDDGLEQYLIEKGMADPQKSGFYSASTLALSGDIMYFESSYGIGKAHLVERDYDPIKDVKKWDYYYWYYRQRGDFDE